MEYKKYKDIIISRLGFGNMRLPEKDGRIDREKASAMIDRAMKGGVTYYDTAFMYHHEDSETFLGEVLPSYPRESFYLATKFNIGFNPDYRHVFETQLKKLKTDYFDFISSMPLVTIQSILMWRMAVWPISLSRKRKDAFATLVSRAMPALSR